MVVCVDIACFVSLEQCPFINILRENSNINLQSEILSDTTSAQL